jgi:hypothetical protein
MTMLATRTVAGVTCPRGAGDEDAHRRKRLSDIVYRPGIAGWGHVVACVADEALAVMPSSFWHAAGAFPCECIYPSGSRWDPAKNGDSSMTDDTERTEK